MLPAVKGAVHRFRRTASALTGGGALLALASLVDCSSFAGPVMNLPCEGMEISNVLPSLTMSKMLVPTRGSCPITRMSAGRWAKMKPLTS